MLVLRVPKAIIPLGARRARPQRLSAGRKGDGDRDRPLRARRGRLTDATAHSDEEPHAQSALPFSRRPGLRARGWRQEALLRLLENVLSVGEDPDNLVVYAALGKAARNSNTYS